MSIWFYLWLALSAALLWFLGWTVFILYRQKQAWKSYASKKKLRYSSPRPLASPELSGVYNNYTVGLFTAEHAGPESKTTRKLTAVEVTFSNDMPFDAALASGDMVPLVRSVNLKEEIIPAIEGWDKTSIAATNNRAAFEQFLTAGRLEAILSLMKIRNAFAIVVFRSDVTLLRIDTPDPLDSAKKLDYLLNRLTKAAKLMEVGPEEAEKLRNAKSRAQSKLPEVNVEEAPVVLQLEDEDKNSGL